MTAAENLEIEIKVELESFAEYLKLIGFLGSIDREEHHHNAFFDSPDRALSEAGYALRVRATDTSGSVTLKSRGSTSDSLAVRREYVAEIGAGKARELIGGRADLLSLNCRPTQIIRTEHPGVKPELMLRFCNHRQIKRFYVGDREYDLEIDRTEFVDGSVDYELEVELTDAAEAEKVTVGLQKIFATLAIPYRPQSKSKFERALERARVC